MAAAGTLRAHVAFMTLLLALAAACGREREMPNMVEMPDSMPVMRAMQDPYAMDSMLDTIPGGEMARGHSTAAMKLLLRKAEPR